MDAVCLQIFSLKKKNNKKTTSNALNNSIYSEINEIKVYKRWTLFILITRNLPRIIESTGFY